MQNKLIAALREVIADKTATDDPDLKLIGDELTKLMKSPKMKELLEKMSLRYDIDKKQATKVLLEELGTQVHDFQKKGAA